MQARRFVGIALGLTALACGSSDDSGLGGQGTGGSGGSNTGGNGTGGNTGGSSGAATGGAAGSASGGTAGQASGGTAGTSGGDCDGLEKQYEEILADAKACNGVNGLVQCTKKLPNQLACPCETFVNPENVDALNALEGVKAEWDNLQCAANVFCPEIACQVPAGATCTNSGEKGSHCEDLELSPGG